MPEDRKNPLHGWKRYKHIGFLLIFCGVLLFSKSKAGERLAAVFSEKEGGRVPVVVIDAGHGGADPGKVGQSGTLEKEINLSVVLKLREFLERDGIQVVLTRENDDGLYSADAQNRKREDMAERVRIIAEAKPDFVVSIHQNSYPTPDCKGAQMFYYKGSEASKRLAELLQKKFLDVLQDGNKRKAKENTDYYLLRKTECPIVIAECGFLSNPSEEALLKTEEYQEKVAEALYLGIKQYISEASEQ